MEEKLITSLDGNLKVVGGEGVKKIRPSKINEVGNYSKEAMLESYSKLNSKTIFVDKNSAEMNGIEAGYYYKVDDVANWLWEISRGNNIKNEAHKTIFYKDSKEINSKQELVEIIKPSFEIGKVSTIKKGLYIKREDLTEVLNNITGLPQMITSSTYIKGFKGRIPEDNEKNHEKHMGDIELTINVNTGKKHPKSHPETVKPKPNTNTYSQQKIENDPYESQYPRTSQPNQTDNGINAKGNRIQETLEKYLTEDEPDKGNITNPKRRKPTKEELIKIIKVIAIAIGAAMVITVGNNIVKGFMEPKQPQPLPEPSPTTTATFDPMAVAENPDGKDIIKTEITDEDLYEYIDLRASYYISDNANLYRSSTDTLRAGTTIAGDATITSFAICERQKDTDGNTILENKQTISLNDENLHETNLEKIYKEWLKNVEGNNFVIKVHLSRKNEVTNQEEGYGWVEVNKETFNDLYESLQNSNKITYQ